MFLRHHILASLDLVGILAETKIINYLTLGSSDMLIS